MDAIPSDPVPGLLYVFAVALQVFPLALLISFAPALLAACFFFVTTRGKPSDAIGVAAIAFVVALAAVSATSGVGLYVTGSRPGVRSEADVVQSVVMQYSVHSVIFYLVGGWLVAQAWRRSWFYAALLAALLIAAELSLMLSEPFATAVLRPLVALSHAAAYVVLLVVVVWWTRRSKPPSERT